MHIGFYAPGWPPGLAANGIITYVAEMKQGLEALGHRVTVLSFPPSKPPSLGERILRRLWGGKGAAAAPDPILDGAAEVADLIAAAHRADPFDIFEMEETFGWSQAVQKAVDLPMVVRLHGPHFLGKDRFEAPEATAFTARRELREGEAMRTASGLTSPSARLLTATVDHYALDRTDGRAIFNPLKAVPQADRWSLDASDPNLILCVGRFDWRKGADILLRAFVTISGSHPDARLIMAGPDYGVQLEPDHFLHFPDYCRAYLPDEVASRIHFLGPQPGNAIVALRKQARITVVASRFETFSYAAVEAMAYGCPVVGTDIYGVGEVIIDGENGWLVPAEDPAALAGAVIAAMDDPEECRRRGRQAAIRVTQAFDPRRIASDTAAYYAEVIARSGATADLG